MPQSTNKIHVKDVKLSTAISGHSEKLPSNTNVLGVPYESVGASWIVRKTLIPTVCDFFVTFYLDVPTL
jgi:hypothetical protein